MLQSKSAKYALYLCDFYKCWPSILQIQVHGIEIINDLFRKYRYFF
jgi:hypothetical protein